jgi:hypothetical protein
MVRVESSEFELHFPVDERPMSFDPYCRVFVSLPRKLRLPFPAQPDVSNNKFMGSPM